MEGVVLKERGKFWWENLGIGVRLLLGSWGVSKRLKLSWFYL